MLTHKAPSGTVFFYHKRGSGEPVHVLRKGREVTTTQVAIEYGYYLHAASAQPVSHDAHLKISGMKGQRKVDVDVPVCDVVHFVERTGGLSA